MLVSHRTNTPGFGSASVTLDRAISPRFILRRASFCDLAQDERVTKHLLGVDSERARHRIGIVLQGRGLETVDRSETPVGDGQAFFSPAQSSHASRYDSADVLEIEWDPGAFDDGDLRRLASTRTTLAPASLRAIVTLADALRSGATFASVSAPFVAALDALRAEGLAIRADSVATLESASPIDQALITAMDSVLSDFPAAPMRVDLEATLGCSGRTLARRIGAVHERYGLLGRGGGRFRGMRDSLRLVLATIYLSHEGATPAAVASSVGYGSVEALDHAFRDAGLPTPRALQRVVREAA